MTEKFEADIECPSCDGTGVFKGMAEKDNFGVKCFKCKGTGLYHFEMEYTPFTTRKERTDINWVIEYNPGICVGLIPGKSPEEFGGMSYEDFREGAEFQIGMEMRKYCCPCWWYQSVDCKKKPEGWCQDHGFFLGRFSNCSMFENKEECWDYFDGLENNGG